MGVEMCVWLYRLDSLISALAAAPACGVQAPSRARVQSAVNQLVAAGAPAVTAVIQGPRGREVYSAGLANVRAGNPPSSGSTVMM